MTGETSPSRPNILFVMADQLSALATSPYGNRDVLTPHLQALADRGVTFERAYCNHPLCVPSRASMMAGRLAGRLPVNDNGEELPASVPTFVHHLRHGGYKTILAGKMHYVGPDQLHGFEERLTTDIYPSDYMWTVDWDSLGDPPRRGFRRVDEATGQPYVRHMAHMVKEAGPVPWSYQLEYDEETHFRALEALRGLARRRGPGKDQPWFLCASYTHPHDPYVNSQEYWDRYEERQIAPPAAPPPGWEPHPVDVWTNTYHGVDAVAPTAEDIRRSRRGYYASTSYFDDKLGQLVAEVERLGLSGNTVVFVTADHGDMCGERGMWFKRTVREWSARVPLIVAGPRVRRGHRIRQTVSLVDLFPTMLDVAGLPPATSFPQPLDGHTLAPGLWGETGWTCPDEAIVENFGEGTIAPVRALIAGHHKLIYTHGRPDQLHDLEADPHEWINLADTPGHRELAADLKERLLRDWDPARVDREIRESQHRRQFLRETLYAGTYTPWDFTPPFDGARQYVRRHSRGGWDPHLGR
jgi:choline-sulfatase